LKNFVLKHSGASESEPSSEQACEVCGLTYSQFRKKGLLGCPSCYEVFADVLEPLLERAHGGESQHLGKIPARAGDDQARQQRLLQLRRELDRSVRAEQYETAARIRDQVRQLESDQS